MRTEDQRHLPSVPRQTEGRTQRRDRNPFKLRSIEFQIPYLFCLNYCFAYTIPN